MLARRQRGLAVAALLFLGSATLAVAQIGDEIPPHLKSVDVDEKLDEAVPLDLTFTDQRGKRVTLADYFEADRPVVLVMAYYRCPMLCSLVLDGLVEVLADLEGEPGEDYAIVTVSIDPTETPTLAMDKRKSYLRALNRPGAERGWHFLTGEKPQIAALADAVGFRYRFLPEREEYSHPAVLTVLTPEGRVSRYFYGVRHDPGTVRLALVEASDGAIGTTVERILLTCYRYDETEGRYAPVAMTIMRIGGGAALVVLASVLYMFWRRERTRHAERPAFEGELGERNVG